jgi:hypothetical protein
MELQLGTAHKAYAPGRVLQGTEIASASPSAVLNHTTYTAPQPPNCLQSYRRILVTEGIRRQRFELAI